MYSPRCESDSYVMPFVTTSRFNRPSRLAYALEKSHHSFFQCDFLGLVLLAHEEITHVLGVESVLDIGILSLRLLNLVPT
jgi:hypothetical protein